jgi:hypothetical protein
VEVAAPKSKGKKQEVPKAGKVVKKEKAAKAVPAKADPKKKK